MAGVLAFTGHRPQKIGGFGPNPLTDRIRVAMREAIEAAAPDQCISGMALGVDQIGAELCIELDIPYIAAVPFAGQEKMWPQASQAHFKYLLSKAESVITVCEGGYEAWKMQKRNEWMVDHADLLLAVYDGTKGGTDNCVQYARKRVGMKIRQINPRDFA